MQCKKTKIIKNKKDVLPDVEDESDDVTAE